MKKYLSAALLAVFLMSGCATADRAIEPAKNVYKAPAYKPEKFEAGAIVVRAKKPTKLEKLRIEGSRKNNRQTAEVAAGTAAAIAAFVISNSSIKTGNNSMDSIASMGATAAAAFIFSAAAGIIYEVFNPKLP